MEQKIYTLKDLNEDPAFTSCMETFVVWSVELIISRQKIDPKKCSIGTNDIVNWMATIDFPTHIKMAACVESNTLHRAMIAAMKPMILEREELYDLFRVKHLWKEQ